MQVAGAEQRGQRALGFGDLLAAERSEEALPVLAELVTPAACDIVRMSGQRGGAGMVGIARHAEAPRWKS